MIASSQNPRFKSWKKLRTRKEREKTGTFLIEGEHLIESALQADWPILDVICTESYHLPEAWLAVYPHLLEKRVLLSPALFAELAETVTPQGIIAVVQKPQLQGSLTEALAQSRSLLLVDRVQDPGNLGTIIRTADAAGVDALILGKGSVDAYAGKVVRATQGSLFHLAVHEGNLAELIPELRAQGWTVLGTSLERAVDYRNLSCSPEEKLALLIGNEAQGVAEDLLALTTEQVKIPIWGRAESLNVAIATGILLYHFQGARN